MCRKVGQGRGGGDIGWNDVLCLGFGPLTGVPLSHYCGSRGGVRHLECKNDEAAHKMTLTVHVSPFLHGGMLPCSPQAFILTRMTACLDIASLLLTDMGGHALQSQVSQAETHARCVRSPVACASREGATRGRREARRLWTWARCSSCTALRQGPKAFLTLSKTWETT